MSVIKSIHHAYIRVIAKALWLNEAIFFYPALRKFYTAQFADKTKQIQVIDVGANRGQSIRFFQQLFATVTIHSFEPNKQLFAQLTKRFATPTCFIHHAGISNVTGSLLFHEHVLDETSSFETPDANSTYAKKKSSVLLTSADKMFAASYEVPVTTLDAFISTKKIKAVDVLKIDVEGHEYKVLSGATNALRDGVFRYIQLEAHADDQYAQQATNIASMLQQFGYKEAFKLKHGFGNFYEVVYARQYA